MNSWLSFGLGLVVGVAMYRAAVTRRLNQLDPLGLDLAALAPEATP